MMKSDAVLQIGLSGLYFLVLNSTAQNSWINFKNYKNHAKLRAVRKFPIFFSNEHYVRGRGSDLCSYDVHRKKYRSSASSMPCTVATVHVLEAHPVRLN